MKLEFESSCYGFDPNKLKHSVYLVLHLTRSLLKNFPNCVVTSLLQQRILSPVQTSSAKLCTRFTKSPNSQRIEKKKPQETSPEVGFLTTVQVQSEFKVRI